MVRTRFRSLAIGLPGLALALGIALGRPAPQQSVAPTTPVQIAHPGTHGGGGG